MCVLRSVCSCFVLLGQVASYLLLCPVRTPAMSLDGIPSMSPVFLIFSSFQSLSVKVRRSCLLSAPGSKILLLDHLGSRLPKLLGNRSHQVANPLAQLSIPILQVVVLGSKQVVLEGPVLSLVAFVLCKNSIVFVDTVGCIPLTRARRGTERL